MKLRLILSLLIFLIGHAALAATVNINCTATIQSVGACGSGDNAEAGVLIAFWASLTDDAPGDADVASNAVDLKDAICASFSITTCTKEAADGAIRKYLENLVRQYRLSKKTQAIPAPTAPVLDNQGNP